jgi:uncharacterized protein
MSDIFQRYKNYFMTKVIQNFPELRGKLNIIEKSLNYFLKLWKEAQYFDKAHDIEHIIKVLDYSIYIIKKEKLNLNEKELVNLIISIIFHDVGLFFVKKPYEIEETVEIFSNFYETLNKKEKNILDYDLIINSIREHSFSKSEEQTNLISKILYDADKLDALGVRGFYRMIVFNNKDRNLLNPEINYLYFLELIQNKKLTKKDCLEIFNDKLYIIDHFFLKLFWIKEKLNFQSSKELAKKLEKDLVCVIKKLVENI